MHYRIKMRDGREYEVMDVIEALTGHLSGAEAFSAGNVLKYVSRFAQKNGAEDLAKAAYYLDYLLARVQAREDFEKQNKN